MDLMDRRVHRSQEDAEAVQTLMCPLLMTTASDSLLKALEVSFTRSLLVPSSSRSLWPIDVRMPAFEPLSSQGSRAMSQWLGALDEAMRHPAALSLGEDAAKTNVPSKIASFLLHLLRTCRNSRDESKGSDNEVEPRLASMVSDFLESAVKESLKCIDTASNDDYYAWDWIMNCHESAKPDVVVHSLFKHNRDMCRNKEKASSQLPTLWSFFVLRTILSASMESSITTASSSSSSVVAFNNLTFITSPETFNQLLKACLCRNVSLKLCVFDLCALILVRLHFLIQCREDEAPAGGGGSPLDAQLQVAAEYYLSVSKERRLLQSLGSRLRSEKVYRKLSSSYTRSLCGFLLQWQMLRRILGLFVDSYVNDYMSLDWVAPNELPTSAGSEGRDYIKITHVATNSLTIACLCRSSCLAEHRRATATSTARSVSDCSLP